jgi:DNA gyrase subunit A
MEEQEFGERIIPINIEEEMKTAYIDYSMSVIVSRALPDVRDGLKPVHRRVLYGMTELGLAHNRPYKKSARIVGEVLGKYHPHGDSSVYDTMVRMAQEWSMRYLLVDGQGNFGSIDGDSPAAMRYTEARLTKIAEEILADIDKDTVDFRPNFDDALTEPTVLPSRIPNLLVNGASGIAVGMATNMPPHNLSEVIDGIVAYIDNHDITIEELMQLIKAPDFPTAGIIYGYEGVKAAFETGRGRIVIRGRAEIEEEGNKTRIIVTEIPYLVNKATMVMKTADLVNEKVIEGISEIRDESDRQGIRVVYEIKRDADAHVVLNQLYKYTPLQSSFSVNNIALVKGRPEALNLKDLIKHYFEHRHEVLIRKTKYELAEAEKRAHILEGLLIALDNIDEVIKIIRGAESPEIARNGLIDRFGLSEVQAKAILDMRLQNLTRLSSTKIREEFAELQKQIEFYNLILSDVELRYKLIKEDLLLMKEKHGDARRSEIVYSADDVSIEELIKEEDMVITISHLGYIKRTTLADYKSQGRGGKGSKGANSRDEDFIEDIFVANTHSYILLFTEKGKCFWLKVYELPEGGRNTKGRNIQNILSIDKDDKIRAYISVKKLNDPEYLQNNYLTFCTKKGIIKKTTLEAYSRPRANGIIALNINDGDQLIAAVLTQDDANIVLATKYGQAIRFEDRRVRPMGRGATGVRGVRLNESHEDDEVVGMISISDHEHTVLVVSENGYGKRTAIDDYRITNRGGKGVKTINITEKTGKLVAICSVTDDYDLMIINKSGITIRLKMSELRVMGRNTQGVRLININDKDSIASVTSLLDFGTEDEIEIDTTENPIENNEVNDKSNENE